MSMTVCGFCHHPAAEHGIGNGCGHTIVDARDVSYVCACNLRPAYFEIGQQT
jgi:hypothetical protein